MKNYVLLFSAILLLLPSAASHAAPILLNAGTGALHSTSYDGGTNLAVGYRFSLAISQAITSFGLYDAANNAGTGFQGDGLLSPNDEVNLWTSTDFGSGTGTLLAISAPIPQSGADASGFIYQSSYTPLNGFTGTLVAGTQYVVTARYNTIGGVNQGNNIDAYRASGFADSASPAAFVSSFGPGQFSGTGTFYQFPGNVANADFVGPNLEVGPVPEPATILLMFVGFVALLALPRGRSAKE